MVSWVIRSTGAVAHAAVDPVKPAATSVRAADHSGLSHLTSGEASPKRPSDKPGSHARLRGDTDYAAATSCRVPRRHGGRVPARAGARALHPGRAGLVDVA